jgi:hypothetical protein
MKAFLLLVLLAAAQGSILTTEEMAITDLLHEYTLLYQEELPEDLSLYTVIVIATPSKVYEEQDIEAVKAFVETGGGLMLLAEENNKDGTTLVLNQLSQQVGITFNTDRIYDDQEYFEDTSWIVLTKFPLHPVFQGVTRIVYTSGCSLEAEGILVQSSSHAYAEKYDGLTTVEKGNFPSSMVFKEMGKGRIFACGDKELFNTFLSLQDNTLFALNVFDWLAGHPDNIAKRLTDRDSALNLISEAETLLQSTSERGLDELFPESLREVETLISEAQSLYNAYRYAESLQKALQAKQSIEDGEVRAQQKVNSTIQAAQDCLSEIEEGARKYLPSQLDAALYYLNEIDNQKTYLKKIEKADECLSLCKEIRTGLEGAAKKEISLAQEKVNVYRGLFGRTSHHSARVHLEYAEESYKNGKVGDAITFAQQSQIYSDRAAEEQKKDYILAAGIILIGVLLVYMYVRKRT